MPITPAPPEYEIVELLEMTIVDCAEVIEPYVPSDALVAVMTQFPALVADRMSPATEQFPETTS